MATNDSSPVPQLADYDVSEEVGFLLPEPLAELPKYFEPWAELARNLPTLIENRQLKDKVNKMPYLEDFLSQLDEDEEVRYKQMRLAYMILTFIGSGYIRQDGDANLAKVIPDRLAKPWHFISQRLGLKPVPCMASVVLNNYQKVDDSRPLTLDNMKAICTFPESRGSEWFFLLTVQVELDAVPGIKAVLEAMRAVQENDEDKVIESLVKVKDSLRTMIQTCKRMSERLNGDTFYNVVRRFLAGYGRNQSSLPEGLLFEGVSDEPFHAIGGSAAQSSTIQIFDAGLGMEHEEDKQEYLTKVREYMPPPHSKFIEAVAQGPSVKQYVLSNDRREETVAAYKDAIIALRDFRSYHIQLVRRYIIKPSGTVEDDRAGEDPDDEVLRGTGGTDIIPFLKSIRDTTKL